MYFYTSFGWLYNVCFVVLIYKRFGDVNTPKSLIMKLYGTNLEEEVAVILNLSFAVKLVDDTIAVDVSCCCDFKSLLL